MKIFSRFLPVLLALPLATGACGDDDSPAVEPDADFSAITEAQAALAIETSTSGAAFEALLTFGALAEDPTASCPTVQVDGDRTTLVGDGCTTEDGTTISGRATGINAPTISEILFGNPSGDVRYDFDNFRLQEDGEEVGLDGTVEISDLSNEDGTLRSTLTLTLADETIFFDHQITCVSSRCEPSGSIEFDSFGGFAVSGSLDDQGAGSLRLSGANVMTVELNGDTCVPYLVDGAEAGNYCPEGPEALVAPNPSSFAAGALRLLNR